MEYQNGQFISAYTANDTLFEGKVYTRKDGTKVCLREDRKWLPIDKLKMVKIIESEVDNSDVQSLIDNDIGKCDMDKLGTLDDSALEKLGNSREDELIKSGIKINKGDYSQGFISKIKASKIADDANAGNISTSAALEKYKQSKDVDIEKRINQTLKENLFDDLDTEKAYSTNPTIDTSFDDDFDEEDFEDDIEDADFYSSYDDDTSETFSDDEDYDFDDEFDAIYNDETLLESKKEDKKRVREFGPTPEELHARDEGWIYGDAVTQTEDDILCGDSEIRTAYMAHFDGPKNDKTYEAWKSGYKNFIRNWLEIDYGSIKESKFKEASDFDESSDEIRERIRERVSEEVEHQFEEAIDKYTEECEKFDENELLGKLCEQFKVSIKLEESKDAADKIEKIKEAVIEKMVEEVGTAGIFQICKAIFPVVKSFLGGGQKVDFNKNPQQVKIVNPKIEFNNLDAAKNWCKKNVGQLLNKAQAFVIRQLKIGQGSQPAQQVGGLVMGAHLA